MPIIVCHKIEHVCMRLCAFFRPFSLGFFPILLDAANHLHFVMYGSSCLVIVSFIDSIKRIQRCQFYLYWIHFNWARVCNAKGITTIKLIEFSEQSWEQSEYEKKRIEREKIWIEKKKSVHWVSIKQKCTNKYIKQHKQQHKMRWNSIRKFASLSI